jgi:hypothetical protein
LVPVIALLVLTFSIMTEGSMPSDDEIVSLSNTLIDDSLRILKRYPVDSLFLNDEEWPESIKALSPLSLWINHEGLYIITKKQFVVRRGVFIPREDSQEYSENTSMPSYTRIAAGIYKFYAD